MDKYYYSAGNNEFIPVELESQYRDAGTFPDDAVIVADDISAEFIQIAPSGKVRAAGDDGLPEWVDIPPPTHDELIVQAEAERQLLLDEASSITADWRTELALDIISEGDKTKLINWMKYIKAVKAVDVSTAPDVSWPVQPEA